MLLRQKMEPGSLCVVYLFQHQLTFTSGLGNKESTLSDKQNCINFYRSPLVTFETSFFGECITCYDEMHKIQVYVVM